jgi:integrase
MSSKTETLGGRYAGVYRRGNTYSYVVRDASGKQRWVGGFRSPSAAMKDRDKVRSDIARGNYVAPTRQTFEEFSAEWMEARRSRLRPSTLASYADLFRDHVNPRVGHIWLPKLTAAHLDALYGELLASGRRYGTGGLSPRTVRYVHTVIRAALQTAFRWGRVARNVADLAEPPTVAKTEARHWNAGELRRFLGAAETDRLGALLHLAAMTGLRRGEVCGLRWQDVDFDRGTITVVQSRILVDGKVLTSTPKTDAGRRTVALDPRSVEVLRSHKATQGRERLKAGPAWQDSGLVFTREDGRPLPPDWVYRRFTALVRDAGLPVISFHGLRHSHATALLGAGVDLKLASSRLGHSSVRITADTYQHVERAMDKDAAARAAALVLG